MYIYEISEYPEAEGQIRGCGLAGPLGQTGKLRHFSPSELVLSPEDTVAVLRFFWPEMDLTSLGAVTDSDRDFAQGLLLEAVDASCTMETTESIFKKFYLKVPTSFGSILKSAAAIAAKAIENRWSGRCRKIDPAKVRIYESVRKTLARNFVTVMRLRLQTGELMY
jgi:hypothetical protein